MTSGFGRIFRVNTFGESHGRGVGVVIEGVPPRIVIDAAMIQRELDRRKPGQSAVTTSRREDDGVEILSGVFEGVSTGSPLCLFIANKDADSSKYAALKDLYRPGHADFTYEAKYGIRDWRGGGRSSARETAARVAAGAIAKSILSSVGISIVAFTVQVGSIIASKRDFGVIEKNDVRAPDLAAAKKMEKLIMSLKASGDSIGSVVEVVADGVPAGLGEPTLEGLDAVLAHALMSINAIKGVEIGAGFGVVSLKGSECNDPFALKSGKVVTTTNNAGGILGGISTGMPIVARVAIKPPSSIAREQSTVRTDKKTASVKVEGRHDPCLAPRAVPVVEAMTAIVLCDLYLLQKVHQG